jgi:hypothetical protein
MGAESETFGANGTEFGETGILNNYLPKSLNRALGSLLVDLRSSNPAFTTDASLSSDITQVFKNPYGYYAGQKRAGAEQGDEQDDSGRPFLVVASILLIGGSLLYFRAVRNRQKIRAAIRARRESVGGRRRRSSRKSRTVGRR